MEPHHPLLVDDGSVDVDGDLEGDLVGHGDFYLFLYDFFNWMVEVYWFVDIDGFIEIDRSFYLNIDGLFNNLWGWSDFDFIGYFLLHLYYFLYYSLGALDVFRHLNSHLDWLLNYDFLNNLFGRSSILILELSLEHLDLFLQFVLIPF